MTTEETEENVIPKARYRMGRTTLCRRIAGLLQILCLGTTVFASGCAHLRPTVIRVAIVDRTQLQIATAEWARRRLEGEIAKEVVAPEVKEQIEKHNRLQVELQRLESELMRRRMESVRGGPPPFGPPFAEFRSDPGYRKLSEAVAEARRPIADILNRRAQRQSELQYPIKELIQEYAKGRFDLVLDRSGFDHSVLYRDLPEVIDITQGVIDRFRAKEK